MSPLICRKIEFCDWNDT